MGKDSGGGSGYEAPDSLKSQATARGIDLICEGPIQGLVNGFKSVYINDTPLENPDGTRNFQRVSIQPRYGTLTQPLIAGIPSVESETSVAQRVQQATPVTRAINDVDTDAIRLNIGIPALVQIDTSSGDTTGTSVSLKVELQPNGMGWSTLPLFYASTGASWGGSFFTSGALTYRMRITYLARVTWDIANPINTYVDVAVQYRLQGAGSWTTHIVQTYHASTQNYFGHGDGAWYATQEWVATSDISYRGIPPGVYEFRVVAIGGGGTVLSGPGNHDMYDEPIDLPGEAYGYTETLVIEGKCGSRYQREIEIRPKEIGNGPWNVRVTRLTADSGSQYLQNETWWDSYSTLQDEKLRYPNTALMGFSVDAKQFTSVPKRAYDLYLKIVKIPSNYNPLTRQYSGAWNGTFTTGWTDNPAWCFYDLITNERYGLGTYIPEAMVDKWALYTIGQYCDQLVPTGRKEVGTGNTIYEPRFTLNTFIADRDQAFKVVNDLASVFRGMAYWAGGSIVAVQDSPSDPVALFTPANVVGGMFNYSGTSKKARHTAALVTWNDPSNLYKTTVEYVEDRAGIVRYGYNPVSLNGMTTSQGQAHRVGRWLLYTEQMENEVVTFRTGINSAYLRPGNVISVQDPDRAGVRFGGRIASATTTALTLDAGVTLEGGETYTVSVTLEDGTLGTRSVTNGAGTHTVLNLASALSSAPAPNAMWVITASNVEPQSFRVLSIAEASKSEIEVSALTHAAGKYALVEQGLALGEPPISIRPPPDLVLPPVNLNATLAIYTVAADIRKYRLNISWERSPSANVSEYICEYRKAGGNWIEVMPGSRSLLDRHEDDLWPGDYEVRVCAVNLFGVRSTYATDTVTLTSAGLPFVADPVFIDARCTYGVKIHLEWEANADPLLGFFELRTDLNWGVQANLLYQGRGTIFEMTPDGSAVTFYLRAHDTVADYSEGYDTKVMTYAAPSAPSGVEVTASYEKTTIFVTPWTDPTIAFLQVWRASVNNRASALQIGEIGGSVYVDAKDIVAGTTYYYWLRFLTIFGTFSNWSAGDTAGHTGGETPGITIDIPALVDDVLDEMYADNLVPPEVVSSLPTLPDAAHPIGKIVFLTTDGKLYRNVGNVWTKTVAVDDLDRMLGGSNLVISYGNNLIANGNSELGASAVGLNPEGIGVVNEPSNARAGQWCRKLVTSYPGEQFLWTLQGSLKAVQCVPGQKFRFSVWVKCTSGGATLAPHITFYNSDGAGGWNWLQDTGQTYEATGTYQEMVHEATAPAGATFVNFYMHVQDHPGTYYFDDATAAEVIETYIEDGSVTAVKLAASIPIPIIWDQDPLPDPELYDEGRLLYWTIDGKLYRNRQT